MKTFLVVCIGGALAVAGCQKKDDSTNALIETTPSPSIAAPTPATSAPTASSAVPVEEDFEQKAEGSISASNLNAEIAKLEQEIGQ